MEHGNSGIGLGIAVGVAGTLLSAVAIWLVAVYSGAYNVAATVPHADVVRWTLDTTVRRSVNDRANRLTPPQQLREEILRNGAIIYARTCVHCHGAPGAEREYWSGNMRPRPPELAHAASEWGVREAFWIIKHGIKMTGMPAFGLEHDDETIWGIATFVMRLPGMTSREYQAATGDARHDH